MLPRPFESVFQSPLCCVQMIKVRVESKVNEVCTIGAKAEVWTETVLKQLYNVKF